MRPRAWGASRSLEGRPSPHSPVGRGRMLSHLSPHVPQMGVPGAGAGAARGFKVDDAVGDEGRLDIVEERELYQLVGDVAGGLRGDPVALGLVDGGLIAV